jgi:hypothetical protein
VTARVLARQAQLADDRGCREQRAHPVALDDLPRPGPGGRVEHPLVHHCRPPGAQRPQHALDDAVDERQLHGGPQDVAVGLTEDAPVEFGGADEEPGRRQDDAERLMAVTAEILHEQGTVGGDGKRAAVLVTGGRGRDEFAVPPISFEPLDRAARPPDDHRGVDAFRFRQR